MIPDTQPDVVQLQRKLTWGEVKDMIESAGVRDTDEIDSIDISWGALDQFAATKDEICGWRIRL